MTRPVARLYLKKQPNAPELLAQAISTGIRNASIEPTVFFRADDIAIPSGQFFRMIEIFSNHAVPLALATVPTWLNRKRLTALRTITEPYGKLWCWHQHGYRHTNFEQTGKKQEFGPARSDEAIRQALTNGRTKLESLLADDFTPIFTPPWNRCSEATLKALPALGFAAISRSRGAVPPAPANLPDLQVNVDLHTRKEPDSSQCLQNLLAELESSLASGLCGIMLHHQRMNGRSFEFLDLLLTLLRREKNIAIVDCPTVISRCRNS